MKTEVLYDYGKLYLYTCGNEFFYTINRNFGNKTTRKNIFDIYVTEYGTALTNILPILFLYLNTVTVTTGTFEP